MQDTRKAREVSEQKKVYYNTLKCMPYISQNTSRHSHWFCALPDIVMNTEYSVEKLEFS